MARYSGSFIVLIICLQDGSTVCMKDHLSKQTYCKIMITIPVSGIRLLKCLSESPFYGHNEHRKAHRT
jgi:hypothetical protein